MGLGLDGRGGLTVVVVFELGGRDAPELAVKSTVVEPVDVFEGGELDVIEAVPWTSATDELGLVEPDGGLGQGVVVGVTPGPDRGNRARGCEPLAVADRQVLTRLNRSKQHRLVARRLRGR